METDFTQEASPEPLKRDIKVNSDDKMLAIIAHAGGIFFGFIPSLILWVIKKEESPYIASHAKEALNFQISVTLYLVISSILVVVLIGFFLIWVIYLVNVVLCIIAAIKASNGEFYRYPLSIRLIK